MPRHSKRKKTVIDLLLLFLERRDSFPALLEVSGLDLTVLFVPPGP
jgi:hypothetical protein